MIVKYTKYHDSGKKSYGLALNDGMSLSWYTRRHKMIVKIPKLIWDIL